jgi:hypothetical protein
MSAEEELDSKIPLDAVLRATHNFLNEAGWVLEFDDGQMIPIPRQPEPFIISRAFIKAHAPDVFLDDHFEAVVALNPERLGHNLIARAGKLKLYFNREGKFVSEDRYPPAM